MIRVLVAEDLPTARALVVEILRADPDIEVVGEATNGAEAVAMARRLRPDLVTMDILMPEMDGFEATRRLMAEMPVPIVIVSSLNVGEVTFSMQALKVGALAALPKPRGPGSPGFAEDARRLVATVKAMARVAVLRRPAATAQAPTPARRPTSPELPVTRSFPRSRVVAMAASTGGPAAFSTILSDLPGDFRAPILLVQHVAHGFAEGFARWLDGASPLQVKVAEPGEPLMAGVVYVAPDGTHLGVARGRAAVELSNEPPIGGFRPSANHLFRSVAASFGPFVTAVILSGMGRDGADGLVEVARAGGRVIAQDEATSVVFGMPGAAHEAGVVDLTLPLGGVAGTLRGVV